MQVQVYELRHVSFTHGPLAGAAWALTYYTGVVRPLPTASSIGHRRRACAAWLRTVVVAVGLAIAIAAAAPVPVDAGPKPPPVPSFWLPIYSIWSTVFEAVPVGAPVIDRLTVFVAFRDGRLSAVSQVTGAILWSINPAATAGPEAGGGLVFIISSATLAAFDGTTGNPRWQQPLGSTASMAPVLGPGGLTVVTSKPELLMISPADGRILWRRGLSAPGQTDPVADGEHVYVGLTDGTTIAANVKTGADVWSRRFGGNALALTVIKDRLFVGTSDDFLCAVSTNSGKLKWRWRTGGDVVGAVTADAKRVYFASLDNSVVALGWSGGDLKWEQRLPSRPVGGPRVVGDSLLVATVASELKALTAAKGILYETFALTGRPAQQLLVTPWADGEPPRAIVLTGGGQLLAMGPRVEPPLESLDVTAIGSVIAPEMFDSPEPPLVPMLYPPGRLVLPETRPPLVIKK
jgi:outer membrane protein assembly factor BamB